MPVASGSIAFLGAARFQGFWDASLNEATGSGYYGAPSGKITTLFTVGASTGGGYAAATGLTSSVGNYWQVTGSGTTNVDGHTNWNLNDWCIYSGSAAGGAGKWARLAFEDTIASIVIGDLTSGSFHMGGDNDKHIIFASGSVHSGSSNFTYDYNTNRLFLTASTGGYLVNLRNNTDSGEFIECAAADGNPSIALRSTTGGEGAIYIYDDDGALGAAHSRSGTLFGGAVPTTPGVVALVSGSAGLLLINVDGDIHLSASANVNVPDDVRLTFGEQDDAQIYYRETGDDYLVISGSANGLVLSGTNVIIDGTLQGASPLAIEGDVAHNGNFTQTTGDYIATDKVRAILGGDGLALYDDGGVGGVYI